MATKRKTYTYREGKIIDVEENHDGKYGAPGTGRVKKSKPTEEQMQRINHENKIRRCRQRLLEYFNPEDIFTTWTYEVRNRPQDMKAALDDFQKAIRTVRREYKKRGRELFWIKNIEKGTKGAWHIHLVVNSIGDETAGILQKAWRKGGVYVQEIKLSSKIYDEDFTKLASYMTKDENTREEKADGSYAKPRLKEASYSTSRNMPLKKPKTDRLMRWKKEVRPKKGYYIARMHEGVNPVTGYLYRRYTMIRITRKRE